MQTIQQRDSYEKAKEVAPNPCIFRGEFVDFLKMLHILEQKERTEDEELAFQELLKMLNSIGYWPDFGSYQMGDDGYAIAAVRTYMNGKWYVGVVGIRGEHPIDRYRQLAKLAHTIQWLKGDLLEFMIALDPCQLPESDRLENGIYHIQER